MAEPLGGVLISFPSVQLRAIRCEQDFRLKENTTVNVAHTTLVSRKPECSTRNGSPFCFGWRGSQGCALAPASSGASPLKIRPRPVSNKQKLCTDTFSNLYLGETYQLGFIMRSISLSSITAVLVAGLASGVAAAPCGNSAGGFNAWKADFAQEAVNAGVGQRGLDALAQARYAAGTISADRNQKSFKYTLGKFLQIRGADTIVAQGRKRKARNAAFYQALEARFGVPAGVVIAIHGMETGFGGFMGDSSVVSAITTLTYDCRRSDFFRPHALGALKLVDAGAITGATKGARHGELGHTQFLPGNALRYGVDGDGDGRVDFYDQADALASTANFLRQKGWQPGVGYGEGQPNFNVIKQWNAATVYQQAIALMAARIDG